MMPDRVSQSFLSSSTLSLAQSLLGCCMHSFIDGVHTSGMIVETEAYHGDTDEACHCYYSRTPRNEVMFQRAGLLYVYKIYGIHHCINVVTEAIDTGAAVLIRALEPCNGIETMRERRGNKPDTALSNGPGKLAQALGITDSHNGEDLLTSKRLFLSNYQRKEPHPIVQTTRIGISKAQDLPWRFYIQGHPCVSKR